MARKQKLELQLPGDDDGTRRDISSLVEMGYKVERHTVHHFKIGPVNYWPGTGKISVDASPPRKDKGFRSLLTALAEFPELLEHNRGATILDFELNHQKI